MKVFKECCKNCLLSKDRIVSSKTAKGIVKDCISNQSYFICHKASIQGKDIMCKSYFDSFGHTVQLVRIAQRLNCLEFVEQSETEKLPSYQQMVK